MIPIEYEIGRVKSLCLEMFELVKEQIVDSKKALLTNDTELAADVIRKEARVNAFEISLDRECEELFALQAPVAADLRFTMAVLKISSSLERIGDHAYRISSFIYEELLKPSKELVELLQLIQLFDELESMLDSTIEAFEKEDVKTAKKVFKKDKVLNRVNNKTPELLGLYAEKNKVPNTADLILLSRVVSKLERTGDMITNISEEIIFFIESKVVKHKKKNKRIRKQFNTPEA